MSPQTCSSRNKELLGTPPMIAILSSDRSAWQRNEDQGDATINENPSDEFQMLYIMVQPLHWQILQSTAKDKTASLILK